MEMTPPPFWTMFKKTAELASGGTPNPDNWWYQDYPPQDHPLVGNPGPGNYHNDYDDDYDDYDSESGILYLAQL